MGPFVVSGAAFKVLGWSLWFTSGSIGGEVSQSKERFGPGSVQPDVIVLNPFHTITP
jgi:hypothetical protein